LKGCPQVIWFEANVCDAQTDCRWTSLIFHATETR
jgi:hypothetical protein